jgi:hypothetical protein
MMSGCCSRPGRPPRPASDRPLAPAGHESRPQRRRALAESDWLAALSRSSSSTYCDYWPTAHRGAITSGCGQLPPTRVAYPTAIDDRLQVRELDCHTRQKFSGERQVIGEFLEKTLGRVRHQHLVNLLVGHAAITQQRDEYSPADSRTLCRR